MGGRFWISIFSWTCRDKQIITSQNRITTTYLFVLFFFFLIFFFSFSFLYVFFLFSFVSFLYLTIVIIIIIAIVFRLCVFVINHCTITIDLNGFHNNNNHYQYFWLSSPMMWLIMIIMITIIGDHLLSSSRFSSPTFSEHFRNRWCHLATFGSTVNWGRWCMRATWSKCWRHDQTSATSVMWRPRIQRNGWSTKRHGFFNRTKIMGCLQLIN